jgi:hypothetical protein
MKHLIAMLVLAVTGAVFVGDITSASMVQTILEPTPYHRSRIGGSGYEDRQLSEDQWEVEFTGNRAVTGDLLIHYFALRAAEIGQEEGRPYFTVQGFKHSMRSRQRRLETCVSTGQRPSCQGQHEWRETTTVYAATVVTFYNEPALGTVTVDEVLATLGPLYLD